MSKDIEKLEKIYGKVLWTDKPHNFLGLSLNFTRFILTEKKLIVRRGLFNLNEENVELYRVLDSSIQLNLIDRVFGIGNVILHSKDASSPTTIINLIKSPYEFQRLLEERVEIQQKEYGVLGKDIVGSAAHLDK